MVRPWEYRWSSAAAYALGRSDPLVQELNPCYIGLAEQAVDRRKRWQELLLAVYFVQTTGIGIMNELAQTSARPLFTEQHNGLVSCAMEHPPFNKIVQHFGKRAGEAHRGDKDFQVFSLHLRATLLC